jgi:biopolymer transport protein ExbB/TolQ/phage FluMu protein Com
MYFQLTCEKCTKRIKVREEHAGKKVKCPHCHHLQVVRMPEPDPADAPAFQIDTGPREEPGGLAIDTGGRKPRPAEQPAESQISQIVPHDTGSFTDGTEVGLGISAIWAAIGTAVFFAIFVPLYYVAPKSYLPALFVARGWVPFVLVFFMAWSSAILVIKFRKLQRQRESMLFDLLPNDIARDITADNAVVFSRHVRGLPTKPSESFLVNRVLRGLEHFRVLRSNTEVSDRLESQADIDQNAVESSYTLLKVFIWAIPILGFIGTVIGISAAVGGFEAGMADAADTEALKESLGSVTGGLSTAFDTTLIALVMSIFIMFPASSLQKAEEDLLNWVAEYCNENLLKRLKDGKAETVGVSSDGIDDAALKKSIDAAMARHHAEIEAWSRKLEAIGAKITKEVVKGFAEVDGDIQKRQADAAKTAEQLTRTLTTLGERTATVQQEVAGAMQESATSLRGYLTGLQEGLTSLNRVLVDLGGRQVVVERRGWSLFGRKNGK